VLRSDRSLSSKWSLETRTPFLDKDFVNYYMSIEPKLKMYTNKIEKFILRKSFENENLLPDNVLWRRKEAFSDGCSSNKKSWHTIIKNYIDNIISDNVFEKSNKFTINKPVLKETYYYYSIFNSYFNKHNIIPHYWLPKWCGNINDPSARELGIYQQSK